MKALLGAFNQEKALVGAFFVIANLRMDLFEALMEGGAALQRTVSAGPEVEAVRARHQELRRRKTISHKKTSAQEDRADIESTTGL